MSRIVYRMFRGKAIEKSETLIIRLELAGKSNGIDDRKHPPPYLMYPAKDCQSWMSFCLSGLSFFAARSLFNQAMSMGFKAKSR